MLRWQVLRLSLVGCCEFRAHEAPDEDPPKLDDCLRELLQVPCIAIHACWCRFGAYLVRIHFSIWLQVVFDSWEWIASCNAEDWVALHISPSNIFSHQLPLRLVPYSLISYDNYVFVCISDFSFIKSAFTFLHLQFVFIYWLLSFSFPFQWSCWKLILH